MKESSYLNMFQWGEYIILMSEYIFNLSAKVTAVDGQRQHQNVSSINA